MNRLREQRQSTRAAEHICRSWLLCDKPQDRVVVQVTCERCGRVGREPVRLPLALNEMHTFVLAAKEKLPGKCSV